MNISLEDDGRVFVDAKFDLPNGDGLGRIRGGRIWLEGMGNYAIDEYRISEIDTRANGLIYSIHRKTQWTECNGLLVPDSILTRYYLDDALQREREESYREWDRPANDPERFTLRHYSLPEPDMVEGRNEKKSRFYILRWLNILGFGLILAALIAHLLKRGRITQE